jgi:hypothetical protein
MADDSRRYSFTRDELIEALTRLEAYPATAGPGQRVFINAESMADALIEALAGPRLLVHYCWPPACGDGLRIGEVWSGNLDRVTCEACRTEHRRRFRASLRDGTGTSAAREGTD